jgi:hypothetical protein
MQETFVETRKLLQRHVGNIPKQYYTNVFRGRVNPKRLQEAKDRARRKLGDDVDDFKVRFAEPKAEILDIVHDHMHRSKFRAFPVVVLTMDPLDRGSDVDDSRRVKVDHIFSPEAKLFTCTNLSTHVSPRLYDKGGELDRDIVLSIPSLMVIRDVGTLNLFDLYTSSGRAMRKRFETDGNRTRFKLIGQSGLLNVSPAEIKTRLHRSVESALMTNSDVLILDSLGCDDYFMYPAEVVGAILREVMEVYKGCFRDVVVCCLDEPKHRDPFIKAFLQKDDKSALRIDDFPPLLTLNPTDDKDDSLVLISKDKDDDRLSIMFSQSTALDHGEGGVVTLFDPGYETTRDRRIFKQTAGDNLDTDDVHVISFSLFRLYCLEALSDTSEPDVDERVAAQVKALLDASSGEVSLFVDTFGCNPSTNYPTIVVAKEFARNMAQNLGKGTERVTFCIPDLSTRTLFRQALEVFVDYFTVSSLTRVVVAVPVKVKVVNVGTTVFSPVLILRGCDDEMSINGINLGESRENLGVLTLAVSAVRGNVTLVVGDGLDDVENMIRDLMSVLPDLKGVESLVLSVPEAADADIINHALFRARESLSAVATKRGDVRVTVVDGSVAAARTDEKNVFCGTADVFRSSDSCSPDIVVFVQESDSVNDLVSLVVSHSEKLKSVTFFLEGIEAAHAFLCAFNASTVTTIEATGEFRETHKITIKMLKSQGFGSKQSLSMGADNVTTTRGPFFENGVSVDAKTGEVTVRPIEIWRAHERYTLHTGDDIDDMRATWISARVEREIADQVFAALETVLSTSFQSDIVLKGWFTEDSDYPPVLVKSILYHMQKMPRGCTVLFE